MNISIFKEDVGLSAKIMFIIFILYCLWSGLRRSANCRPFLAVWTLRWTMSHWNIPVRLCSLLRFSLHVSDHVFVLSAAVTVFPLGSSRLCHILLCFAETLWGTGQTPTNRRGGGICARHHQVLAPTPGLQEPHLCLPQTPEIWRSEKLC